MRRYVLFIHGAGTGAYAADRLLADSLRAALGDGFQVDCPRMPDEENAPYGEWKAAIRSKLRAKRAPVLVGHSVGGSVLLKFLCERRSPARIAGLFVIATPI
jgi:uncharacterized protein